MRAKPAACQAAPKAYLYLRLSVDDEGGKALSIEAQRYAGRQYADRNGIDIIGEYVDSGLSGTLSKRPQFTRMIADARGVQRPDPHQRVKSGSGARYRPWSSAP